MGRTIYLSLLVASLSLACSSTSRNTNADGSGGAAGEGPDAGGTSTSGGGAGSGTDGIGGPSSGGSTTTGSSGSSGTGGSNAPGGAAGASGNDGSSDAGESGGSSGSSGTGGSDGPSGSGGAGTGGASGSGGSGAGGSSGSGGSGTGGSSGSGGAGTGGASGSGGSGTGGSSGSGGSGTGGSGGTDTCTGDTCSPECPCDTGQGVCSGDGDCAPGLVCTAAAVAKLGFTGGAMSCMPAHCDNDELDSGDGETSQDCGGECGCRATFEAIGYTGLTAGIDSIAISDLSGDGSTLVGHAADSEGSPTTVPITVSVATGAVTFLENHGAYGYAEFTSSDGSLIAGALSCSDPPDCTDTTTAAVRWQDGADPVLYPFNRGVSALSSSGNVVAYTNDSVIATRWVLSTGVTSYAEELSWVYGISGDGTVVHARLATSDEFDAVWYTQTDEVVTPAYPSDWGGGYIHSISNDGSIFVGHGLVWVGSGSDIEVYPFMSRDGVLEEVEVPDSLYDAIADAISGNGERWIGSARDAVSDDHEAIIWDEAGGIRTLHDELTSRGLELPIDAALPQARLISSNGRIIILEASNLAPFTRIELLD